MGRPKVPDTDRIEPRCIGLPHHLWMWIDSQQGSNSLSDTVRRILQANENGVCLVSQEELNGYNMLESACRQYDRVAIANALSYIDNTRKQAKS